MSGHRVNVPNAEGNDIALATLAIASAIIAVAVDRVPPPPRGCCTTCGALTRWIDSCDVCAAWAEAVA